MSKKSTPDEQEVILEFMKKEVTKWMSLSLKLELTYEQVVTMLAVVIGELLYKENDDDFNLKVQTYLRKKVKKSFESQKKYHNGVQK